MKKSKFLLIHRVRILRTVSNLHGLKYNKPIQYHTNDVNLNTCLIALSNALEGDYSRAAMLAHRAVNLFPRMRNAPALIVELARLH